MSYIHCDRSPSMYNTARGSDLENVSRSVSPLALRANSTVVGGFWFCICPGANMTAVLWIAKAFELFATSKVEMLWFWVKFFFLSEFLYEEGELLLRKITPNSRVVYS